MSYNILFVCTGNICRSPLAEGVFLQKLQQENIERGFIIDSAGTNAWYLGVPPDKRTQKLATHHNIELPHLSRQLVLKDFQFFDLIIAMDTTNYEDLIKLASSTQKKNIFLLRDFDTTDDSNKNIPDPYHGNRKSFEVVYKMIEHCCSNLIPFVKNLAEKKKRKNK
ncbi:MAG: low molecular weight phosphotyrosine protein phosphatase [Fibrobacteria bacterium]|nr:low molecular weight phosphotyrosine protein phosphatase [Fibrobacteria bacterium]